MPDPVPCESCQALIIFIVVANAAGRKLKHMPLNAEPDPGGNVAVTKDAAGTMRGRVLGHTTPLPHEIAYCPHFATCSAPGAHRRRQRKNEARSARDNSRPPRKPAQQALI